MNNLPYITFIFKLNFCFCGVYVYVNISRIDFKKQEIRRKCVGWQQLLVRLHNRLIKIRMTHKPTVYKKELLAIGFTRKFGLTYKSVNIYKACFFVYLNQALVDRFPK